MPEGVLTRRVELHEIKLHVFVLVTLSFYICASNEAIGNTFSPCWTEPRVITIPMPLFGTLTRS